MSPLGKLLGIVMVQRTLSTTALFQQFLWGIAVFIIFTVIAGALLSALLIGGLCAAYHALVLYGLEPQAAQVTIATLTLLIAVIIGAILYVKIHRLHAALPHLLRAQSPIAARINEVTDSFLDGLMNPPSKR